MWNSLPNKNPVPEQKPQERGTISVFQNTLKLFWNITGWKSTVLPNEKIIMVLGVGVAPRRYRRFLLSSLQYPMPKQK